jgi:hypothetical protein
LIQELDSFINKWKISTAFKPGYRREIEMMTMWHNIRKIREHSHEIHRKIRQLRDFKVDDVEVILDSVTDIADRLANLGYKEDKLEPHMYLRLL